MTILALAFAWLADGHADDDTIAFVLKAALVIDTIVGAYLNSQ